MANKIIALVIIAVLVFGCTGLDAAHSKAVRKLGPCLSILSSCSNGWCNFTCNDNNLTMVCQYQTKDVIHDWAPQDADCVPVPQRNITYVE